VTHVTDIQKKILRYVGNQEVACLCTSDTTADVSTLRDLTTRQYIHYLDIFPPGILSFGNLAKVFWAAGFVREFQCFAASSIG
jgi:hypothetical protein